MMQHIMLFTMLYPLVLTSVMNCIDYQICYKYNITLLEHMHSHIRKYWPKTIYRILIDTINAIDGLTGSDVIVLEPGTGIRFVS